MQNIQKLVIRFMILICIASSNYFSIVNGGATFNVLSYGAVGDGKHDDSQAFLRAWEAVCGGAKGSPTLEIQAGKAFLLQPTVFAGPCKPSSLHVQLLGKIVAPSTPNAWKECGSSGSWLLFSEVNNLIMDGSGEIDGQGSSWWTMANGEKTNSKCPRPDALLFNKCENLQLSGLTHVNPPNAHIKIYRSNNARLSNLHIMAPKDSPNTDGIDIAESNNVHIQDSVIGTGDDCIAINNGTAYINITNIACGPGHGISVGSLGQSGSFASVQDVRVYNCSFTGTQNGARIKTWQGGSGYAKKISFQKITLIAADNPIIIDQHYCDSDSCKNQKSSVEVSDITYSDFQGTCAEEKAITLACSTTLGCLNIVMDQVNITSAVPGKEIIASCNNVKGTSKETVPKVPCLSTKKSMS